MSYTLMNTETTKTKRRWTDKHTTRDETNATTTPTLTLATRKRIPLFSDPSIVEDSNTRSLAPKARIIPLDQLSTTEIKSNKSPSISLNFYIR